jgi:rhamnulose-1-phosphate aldolase/alcohol dehydrogenase
LLQSTDANIEQCRDRRNVTVSTSEAADLHDVDALLERSRRLGSDPRVTNYAGGNTSCKTTTVDPVTGEASVLLYVKGSGGDLGTLKREGLATLVLDRVLSLRGRYRGLEHEDEMVGLLDHCRFGLGGAAPSIDTPLHAFLPPAHVDHLHPDSVIALAAAADGETLVKECFGPEVAWLEWRRPGFELALELSAVYDAHPGLRGVVLGGHGLFTWGATSDECEATSLEMIARAEAFLAERGRPEPFGAKVPAFAPLPAEERRERAAALAPVLRGLASTDKRVIGHFSDDPRILELLESEEAPRLVDLGTSCPDHFLRTKVRPLLLDLPPTAPLDDVIARLRELHQDYRTAYAAYYDEFKVADSPAMRGADPAIVLLPGIGMWSYGTDAQTARVAGEFYLNAVSVIRGAESVSSYHPISEAEKFAIEYWLLEEAKLKRRPPAAKLAGRVALVTGGGSGIGRAICNRLVAEGAVVAVVDLSPEAAATVADELGGQDKAVALSADVSDPAAVAAAAAEACLAFGGFDIVVNNAGLSISAPLTETTVEEWDLQHRVMARGSFLCAQAAARVLKAQGMGGDLVYVVSKNSVVAGPNNVAYGAAKADQAHQVRLLAAELGEIGVRVNGVNPDGVVKGSGIFANGWGKQRAEVYGVEESELGRFYADRTLLKTEVLPEHIAAGVFALVGGDLSLTTGAHLPVDGGVTAAFLR